MTTGQEGIKFYLPPDEAAELRRLVAAEDRPMAVVIRRLIRQYIAEEGETRTDARQPRPAQTHA
jgi:hypothetical protein